MQDENYVVFSRYWNEIFITGVLPVLALTFFNLSIWRKIRSSHRFRKLHDKSKTASFATTSYARQQQQQEQPSPLANGVPNSEVAASRHLLRSSRPSPPKSPTANAHHRSVLRLGLPPTRHNSDNSLNQVVSQQPNSSSSGGSSGERSSTPLLMGIVVVFCLCHFFRLFLQLVGGTDRGSITARNLGSLAMGFLFLRNLSAL